MLPQGATALADQPDILALLRAPDWGQGATVTAAMHDPNRALLLTDPATLLHRERIGAYGSVAATLAPEVIETVLGIAISNPTDAETAGRDYRPAGAHLACEAAP
ncbi:MAG: hypothetical protein AAF713_18155 [Pseudomonadota bacterium]